MIGLPIEPDLAVESGTSSPLREIIISVRSLGFVSRPGGPPELAALAQQAERLGFDQIWSGNDFLGGPGVATLAYLLQHTTHIKIGSGVLDPITIHPAQLAALAAGFDLISGGRFLLGVGAGSDVFFSFAGINPDRPAVRTRRALAEIRALMNGRSPAGEPGAGDGWTADGVLEHARRVPLYVGAMGPRMLAVAGQVADGVMSLTLPPGHAIDVVRQVHAAAERAGRDPATLDVAAGIWCSIDEDAARGRHLLARQIAKYSGSLSMDVLEANGFDPDAFRNTQRLWLEAGEDAAVASVTPDMLRIGVAGGATEIIDQCEPLIAAGVRHLSFGPPLGGDRGAALTLLGAKVLPRLKRLG